MKKLLSLVAIAAILLFASSIDAADVTHASTNATHYLGDGITMFNLTDVDDGEEFDVEGPVRGFWVQETDNPDTQTSVGIAVSKSVSGSTYTFTFYPALDDATCDFYIKR